MSPYQSAKELVLATCRQLAREGFLPGTGGNVALRVDERRFAITPSATDYFQMAPDDICILDLVNLSVVEGRRKPSVESGLHARFLRFRRDCNASVHTHQPFASAVTLLNQSLPVTDPLDRTALGPQIPMAPYAPSGTVFLARAFQRTLRQDAVAYLLRNHGIVCGGRDMPEAVDNVRRVEAIAMAWLEDKIRKQSAANPQDPWTRQALSLLKSTDSLGPVDEQR